MSVRSNQSQLETNAAARRQLEEGNDSWAQRGVDSARVRRGVVTVPRHDAALTVLEAQGGVENVKARRGVESVKARRGVELSETQRGALWRFWDHEAASWLPRHHAMLTPEFLWSQVVLDPAADRNTKSGRACGSLTGQGQRRRKLLWSKDGEKHSHCRQRLPILWRKREARRQ